MNHTTVVILAVVIITATIALGLFLGLQAISGVQAFLTCCR